MGKVQKLVIKILVAAFLVTLMVAGVRAFLGAQNERASGACTNNLRTIESAKYQWGQEHHKSAGDIPAWTDILPYLGQGTNATIPKCPDGGVYILGGLGDNPKCSLGGPGHSLSPE